MLFSHRLHLPPALSGERRTIGSKAGQLSYYTAGPQASGEPLLLIHSINAAGSAYEVLPLYEHYCNSRTVYALDLPGFGFSERGDRELYTPADDRCDPCDDRGNKAYPWRGALRCSCAFAFCRISVARCARKFAGFPNHGADKPDRFQSEYARTGASWRNASNAEIAKDIVAKWTRRL